jgi:hypothetical protein
MSPAVTAAILAASVSFLTLVGSLVTQFYGIRRTSRDAEKTIASNNDQLQISLAEQRQQLNRTLAEQRQQLDRTLGEQREHLDRTLAEQRERTLNERFATAADRLGSDKPAAVRLAGVYAMAGLADDWAENRQTCVDVLCAYLRMPYSPDPGHDAPEVHRLAFRADREVRHTVIGVIAAHLRPDAHPSWSGLNLEFLGVNFDGGSFAGCRFGGTVNFSLAEFSGGEVNFVGREFSGVVLFHQAKFSGGNVSFHGVKFSGGEVSFAGAKFFGGEVSFLGAKFSGSEIGFRWAEFTGSNVDFRWAEFTGGTVSFTEAKFFGGEVSFPQAEFSGSEVDFAEAEFADGTVDFSDVATWSRPPTFDDNPRPGVRLPPP